MLMFSTSAAIGEDGMLSVRLPRGMRRGVHELTIIVRDEVRGQPPMVSAEVDPVGDAIGDDDVAAAAAAYQAVYRTS